MWRDQLSKEELQREYDRYYLEHRDLFELTNSHRRFYHRVLNLFRGSLLGSLLDVGCGCGFLLKMAEERGLSTSGIDISPEAVDVARRVAGKSDIRMGIGEELPWPDNHFEYVTCLGSIEHFMNPAKACKEMARVLRPDGLCLILVPNSYFVGHIYMALKHGVGPDESGQDFSERFATKEEWRELLDANDLKVLRIHRWNPPLWASRKVGMPIKAAYALLRPFVPMNLSAQFAFVCAKKRSV